MLDILDKGELETLAPPFHLNPYGGIKAIVNWSLKAGGACPRIEFCSCVMHANERIDLKLSCCLQRRSSGS